MHFITPTAQETSLGWLLATCLHAEVFICCYICPVSWKLMSFQPDMGGSHNAGL